MGQSAGDLAPPGALAGGLRTREAATDDLLELARRADREQGPADRVAAVVEQDERAGLVAARPQLVDHDPPGDRRRSRRVAAGDLPPPDRGHRRGAARLGPRPLAGTERPGAPAAQQLAELHRRLLA